MNRQLREQIKPIFGKIVKKLGIKGIRYSIHYNRYYFEYSNPDSSVSLINERGWEKSELVEKLNEFLESLDNYPITC